MNTAGVPINLPHGYWVDGVHCRCAALRGITGADEEFLGQASQSMLPVTGSTQLLLRCLTGLEGFEGISPARIEGLTVGDREALLLHLRRLTFGNRLQATLRCPRRECGQPMDLDLRVSDLLQPPCPDPREAYQHRVGRNGRSVSVRFRLPTVGDQQRAAKMARSDVAAAAEEILRRCVLSVTDESGRPLDWTADMLEGLAARMAELDPQAELTLDLVCPVCGVSFSTLFDAGDYLLKEIGKDLDRLYREVHVLALHYHWSESEIMAMSTAKRRRYLKLLAESLSGV